jgi:hypothetical protein
MKKLRYWLISIFLHLQVIKHLFLVTGRVMRGSWFVFRDSPRWLVVAVARGRIVPTEDAYTNSILHRMKTEAKDELRLLRRERNRNKV